MTWLEDMLLLKLEAMVCRAWVTILSDLQEVLEFVGLQRPCEQKTQVSLGFSDGFNAVRSGSCCEPSRPSCVVAGVTKAEIAKLCGSV